jgi:hypothetical protein
MKLGISLVTLGVSDIARARAFYERFGFKASSAENDSVAFFAAGGVVLALFGHDALAEDAHIEGGKPPEFRGVSLAHNVRSKEAVDAVIGQAVAAGARLVKAAENVFWGGYSGYFSDPDGHLWEVAYNPFFPLDEQGRIVLP